MPNKRSLNKKYPNKKKQHSTTHPYVEFIQTEINALQKKLNTIEELEANQELSSEEQTERLVLKSCLERYQETLIKMTEVPLLNKVNVYNSTIESEVRKKEESQTLTLMQLFYLMRLGQLNLYQHMDPTAVILLDTISDLCDQVIGAAVYCAKKDTSIKEKSQKKQKVFELIRKLDTSSDDFTNQSSQTTFKQVKNFLNHLWENTNEVDKNEEINLEYPALQFDTMMPTASPQLQSRDKSNDVLVLLDTPALSNSTTTTHEELKHEEPDYKESKHKEPEYKESEPKESKQNEEPKKDEEDSWGKVDDNENTKNTSNDTPLNHIESVTSADWNTDEKPATTKTKTKNSNSKRESRDHHKKKKRSTEKEEQFQDTDEKKIEPPATAEQNNTSSTEKEVDKVDEKSDKSEKEQYKESGDKSTSKLPQQLKVKTADKGDSISREQAEEPKKKEGKDWMNNEETREWNSFDSTTIKKGGWDSPDASTETIPKDWDELKKNFESPTATISDAVEQTSASYDTKEEDWRRRDDYGNHSRGRGRGNGMRGRGRGQFRGRGRARGHGRGGKDEDFNRRYDSRHQHLHHQE